MRSRIAFQPTAESRLTDYISAIAWSPTGDFFAVSAASGEVALFSLDSFVPVFLQETSQRAIGLKPMAEWQKKALAFCVTSLFDSQYISE